MPFWSYRERHSNNHHYRGTRRYGHQVHQPHGHGHGHGSGHRRDEKDDHAARNRYSKGVTKFDYLLVVDFEATCDQNKPYFPNEIIEFPVVVIDVKELKICAEWRKYVRPLKRPILTEFCTQLTGIEQKDVEGADPLQEVVKQFEEWFLETIPHGASCCFATDGPWDLRNFFHIQALKRDGIVASSFFHAWVDIRTTFYHWKGLRRPLKLVPMLKAVGLEFEGREHCGLDDTRNIARLAIAMMKQGCVFSYVATSTPVSTTYLFPPWVHDDTLAKLRAMSSRGASSLPLWLLLLVALGTTLTLIYAAFFQ